jgi:hypothetical protein
VQPVILEGKALQKLTIGVSALSVTTLDDHRIVRFSTSARLRPSLQQPTFPQYQQSAVPFAPSNGDNASEILQR